MALQDKFLEVLQELKAKFAGEALAPSKQDQTEFGYGKAVGVYQGILHAEQRFSALIEAEDVKERG
jgi:hypothetical protein